MLPGSDSDHGAVKRKVYTQAELSAMGAIEFAHLRFCLRWQTFRLLGIDWKEWVKVYWELPKEDLVIEWE